MILTLVLGILVLQLLSASCCSTINVDPNARVAVVANGPSVLHGEQGAFIDGHDVVVRFNTAPLVPINTGSRTDVHVVSAGYTGSFKKDARDRVVVDNHPMLRLIPHPGATSTVTPPRRGATNVLTLVHHILSRNPRQRITLVGIDNVDWTRYDDAHYFAIDHPEKPLWNRWTDRVAIRFHRDERDVWERIIKIYPNITRI